jgi:hypothetical protein
MPVNDYNYIRVCNLAYASALMLLASDADIDAVSTPQDGESMFTVMLRMALAAHETVHSFKHRDEMVANPELFFEFLLMDAVVLEMAGCHRSYVELIIQFVGIARALPDKEMVELLLNMVVSESTIKGRAITVDLFNEKFVQFAKNTVADGECFYFAYALSE